jgi:hypothetical protein
MDDATVMTKLKADLTWIQKHERIILFLVGGLILWFAIGKIDTLIANHDHANLQEAQVAAAVQEEKNQALAAQIAQQAAEYKALAEKVEAQNAALEQANVNLATALTKQQKTDATLPPTELVARFNTLVPAAGATVTPTGVALPSTGAVATVQQLEKVPVLAAQLDNEIAIETGTQKLLDASEGRIVTLNDQITGLKAQAVLDDKVCKDTIKTVKDDARKSKRKWFVAGFVSGVSIRGVVKIVFGL